MALISIIGISGETQTIEAGRKAAEVLPESQTFPHPLVAVLVDNELKSLDTELLYDCRIQPILADSSLGALVYRRSLCFVLAIASREVFPERRLIAGMAIGSGFYHYYFDETPLTKVHVEALALKMRELIAKDTPIHLESWPWDKARKYFRESGQLDTLELIENVNEPTIPLNECDGFRDIHVAPLVNSTAVLKTWELLQYHGGLLLRYPHKGRPESLDSFDDDPLHYEISEEYKERGRVLGVGSVGVLNKLGAEGRIKEYIEVAEALQNKKLASLAESVADRKGEVRMILIAGPSSSGKTTTAKKIAIQLKVLGFQPIPIELDDFFIDRAATLSIRRESPTSNVLKPSM